MTFGARVARTFVSSAQRRMQSTAASAGRDQGYWQNLIKKSASTPQKENFSSKVSPHTAAQQWQQMVKQANKIVPEEVKQAKVTIKST
mmetsp:Transcript_20655/g.32326  ORF Transcript_20655/g.32326 Transcript_20655/m.32326 type:complete len:88 (-) Transcript_20655:164-427(-)